MNVLKIVETESGLAILLSPELRDVLGAEAGKHVALEVSSDRRVTIRPLSADAEEQLRLGGEFLGQYDRAFSALAKT